MRVITTICLRLAVIYFTVLVCLRIMGKRQIGELDISELVTAVFISELATKPITDPDVPLAHGVLPTLLLLCFEVILSFASLKINIFKNIFNKNPTFLISKGAIDIKALEKVRITVNELMTEMRLCGIPDITQIYYAILEPNGKISFCLKNAYQTVTPNDLNMKITEQGIQHPIIIDGDINYNALSSSGKNINWLKKTLEERKLSVKEVFVMCADDSGNIYIVKKENK